MGSMNIATSTTTAAAFRLLHMSFFFFCCFRLGTTDAWVASPGVVGPIASQCRSVDGTVSSVRSSCFESTMLVEDTRRPGQRLPMSTLNAVSVDVERPTTISLDYTDAMHDTHNNNATVLGPLEQSSLSCTDDDLESLSVLDGREPSPIPEPEQKFTSEQKFVNLVVLSMAFGYAFYTILGIDGGMARGWSASEIAMRIPLDNWGAYESYLANKPIITKSLINVIIYLLGDWLSQTAFRKQNLLEFDLARTLRNGFIGLCFGPLVHEYYEFSDAILPPENGLVVRLQKIFMDQTIYLTAKCCLYISAVGLLAGEEWETVSKTVQDKIGGIVLTAWKFWPIVHCVTYSVIPSQHRVLWVNSVDLVWNAILSSAAQKEDAIAVEDAAATPAEERPGTVVGAATAGETNGCGSLQAFDESSESIHATNMTLGGGGAANTTATGALLVGA